MGTIQLQSEWEGSVPFGVLNVSIKRSRVSTNAVTYHGHMGCDLFCMKAFSNRFGTWNPVAFKAVVLKELQWWLINPSGALRDTPHRAMVKGRGFKERH